MFLENPINLGKRPHLCQIIKVEELNMENKKELIKEEDKLIEGQKKYPAVFLGCDHLEGTSKEGKKYNIGKVQFQLLIEQTDKTTGEISVKKPIVDAMCDPEVLPVDFDDYQKCFAIYELPADPSYEKAKPRFVKLVK